MKEPRFVYVVIGYEDVTNFSSLQAIFDTESEAEEYIRDNEIGWDTVIIDKYELNKHYKSR